MSKRLISIDVATSLVCPVRSIVDAINNLRNSPWPITPPPPTEPQNHNAYLMDGGVGVNQCHVIVSNKLQTSYRLCMGLRKSVLRFSCKVRYTMKY